MRLDPELAYRTLRDRSCDQSRTPAQLCAAAWLRMKPGARSHARRRLWTAPPKLNAQTDAYRPVAGVAKGIGTLSPIRSGAAACAPPRPRQHAHLCYYANICPCVSACRTRALCRLLRLDSDHLPGLVDSQSEPRCGLRTSGSD